MNFALAIIALWIGAALLAIAFHPLPLEGLTGAGSPGDIIRSLQVKLTPASS